VPRGRFIESADWIRAHPTFVLTDQQRIIKTSGDKAEIENSQDAKEIAERLLKLLRSIFPSNKYYITPEPPILFYDDLSMQNILVDDDRKITSVVDWECASALPLWKACQLPGFLEGRDRNEEPKRENYAPDDGEEGTGGLDNERVNNIYWETSA
jgi:hypothetical protein